MISTAIEWNVINEFFDISSLHTSLHLEINYFSIIFSFSSQVNSISLHWLIETLNYRSLKFFWIFVLFVDWNANRVVFCFWICLWIECLLVFHFFWIYLLVFWHVIQIKEKEWEQKKANVSTFNDETKVLVCAKIRTRTQCFFVSQNIVTRL